MKPFFSLVWKELASVLRDRTIGIAILIQLFIASFSSALLIGMLSLYDADSAGVYASFTLQVAVTGEIDPVLNGYFLDRHVVPVSFPGFNAAEQAYRSGQVQAIVIPPNPSAAPQELKVILPKAEATGSLILNYIQEPLRRYENVLREQHGIPVRYTEIKGQPPTTFEFIYSMILPILMFFPAFVAGGMVVDSLTEEMENKTLETLLSAPVSLNTIIGAKITAALVLALFQCVAWLALLRLNGIQVQHAAWVLVTALAVAGILSAAGAFVTAFFRDRERSQFIYALGLVVAAGVSTLANLAPNQTVARLAIGDYYTGPLDALVYVSVMAALVILLARTSHRMAA